MFRSGRARGVGRISRLSSEIDTYSLGEREELLATLRVGLIGLGYWGPNYARVLSELPETELVVACDLSKAATQIVRGRYPAVRTTLDPTEVIETPEVDAIVVATPTSTHHALALAALDADKHVLCEKPLATSSAECDELIEAAERAGRVLFAGHTFIFNPAVRLMRELIVAGEVGRVLYCHTARTGLGPIRSDVNALWDLAPHDLSILFYLIDREPVSALATGQAILREDVEDVAFVHLNFEGGTIGAAHLSWLDPYKVRRVTVVGDRRMIVFDDVSSDEKLKVFDRGASYEAVSDAARGVDFAEFKAQVRDGDILVPKVPSKEPLKEQLRHFVDCCLTEQTPETDGVAGRRVVAALEAATRSLHSEGMRVELTPLPVAR
jgi:predicted dehydrogenase